MAGGELELERERGSDMFILCIRDACMLNVVRSAFGQINGARNYKIQKLNAIFGITRAAELHKYNRAHD